MSEYSFPQLGEQSTPEPPREESTYEFPPLGSGPAPSDLRERVYRMHAEEAKRDVGSQANEVQAAVRYVGTRMVPFAGAAAGATLDYLGRSAAERIQRGEAMPGDFHAAAQYEHQQQMREHAESSLPGEAMNAAMSGVGMAGEAVGGGRLIGAIAPRLAGAGGVGWFVGRQVATTPMMPSLYLEDWQRRGGSAANLAGAIANGTLANVVLSGVGAAAGTGRTLIGGVSRGAGTMIGGSAIADQLSQWLHLSEHGGTIQQIREGKYGEAAQHALIQGLTGAAFSLLHGRPEEARQTVEHAVQRAAEPEAPKPAEPPAESPQVQEPQQESVGAEQNARQPSEPTPPEQAPESPRTSAEPPVTEEPSKPAETPPERSQTAESATETPKAPEQSTEHRPGNMEELFSRAGLTAAQRRIVTDTIINGRSERQQAAEHGMSHEWVRGQLGKATEKLKPFGAEMTALAEQSGRGRAADQPAEDRPPGWEKAERESAKWEMREPTSAAGKPGHPHYRVEGEGAPLSPEEKMMATLGGGQENASSAEQRTPPPRETAMANEIVDKERESRGLPPLLKAARDSFGAAWDRAMGMVEADAGLPERLVNELNDKPRAPTREESAVLLRERINLSNAHDRALRAALRAEGIGGPRADRATRDALVAREREISAKIERLDDATRKAGSELGWNLAFRRQLAAEDYSLGGLLRKAELNKKAPLTTEERAEIERLQGELKAALDRLDAAESGQHPPAPDGQPEDMTDLRAAARIRRQAMDAHIKAFKKFSAPIHEKVLTGTKEGLSFTRSLITSLDLSSVFRQGGFLAFAHPGRAARAVPEMLRSLVSEHDYQRAHQQILDRPNFKQYQEAGLYISDMHGNAEEGYAGRFTRLGDMLRKYLGINASERAYTAFLNRVRADSFDAMSATLGLHGEPNHAEAKAIANYINVATGRGSLGRQGEEAAELLSNTFFSPRFVASRFQLLAGQPLYHGSAATRRLIALEYGRYLLGMGAFYGLTKLLFGDEAKIKFDPRSSDFGKIVMNHTHIDPLSGLTQNLVFVSRLITGQTKSTFNEQVSSLRGQRRYGSADVPDVIQRFIRSKLAPIPGLIVDTAAGENVVGQPVTIGSAAANVTVPLALRDVYQAMEDLGAAKGTAASMLGILGMGLQTYDKKPRLIGAR